MRLSILVFVLFLASCQTNNPSILTEAKVKSIGKELVKVMDKQADDWTNGDIDGFMEGYWKSDSLRFVGSRGITYGWEKTKSNYKKGYPSKEAMGRLKFDVKNIDVLSEDAALLLGGFTLFRQKDTLSGNFTLTWKKIDEKWLITSDMTCG